MDDKIPMFDHNFGFGMLDGDLGEKIERPDINHEECGNTGSKW